MKNLGPLLVVIVVTIVVPAGCTPDLGFGDDSRYQDASMDDAAITVDGETPPVGGPHITHRFAEGGFLARVNATHPEAWIYLDLDTGLEVMPETPGSDDTWDIAFRRSNIATNGGISGTGDAAAAPLMADFAGVSVAPADGYEVDLEDGGDEDTIPDYVFRGWYLYDSGTHILTPAPITYVVRTTLGSYVKIRITGYYDAFGTSGHPSFHWAALP